CADLLSFWLRYGIDVRQENFDAYTRIAPFIVLLRLTCLYVFGLYEKPKYKTPLDNLANIARAMTVSTLIIVVVAFFTRAFAYPRSVILLSWALTAALIMTWRIALRYVINVLLGHDYFISRILIIGTDRNALRLMLHLTRRAGIKCELMGYVSTDLEEPRVERERILGSIEDIPRIIKCHHVDEAVIASHNLPRDAVAQIFSYFINTDIIFKTVPDLYEAVVGKVAATSAGHNVPFVELTTIRYGRGWYRGVKRVLDISLSGIAIAVTGPLLMAPIALLIRLTSGRPILHRQERAGLHCRPFTMLKFRTMAHDSERITGPIWSHPDDTRIFRFGRLLRRTHLDELPQFFNVIKGDMSIVGPRPERPHFVQSLVRTIPFYAERLEVKPGITGWSQVSLGYASNLDSHTQKLVSDLYYIENMSLPLDLWIMFKTPGAMMRGKGV
ncbi:MAG: sugar transferase, partial [Candidatus Aureabacteria bacterium]|nr:sugar transferase [Candidatus Auribacterota bacterium]